MTYVNASTEPAIEARAGRELDAIAELARTVARKVIDPRAAEIDQSHEFPADVAAALAESGLLSAAIPEQYGGGGAGMAEIATVARELAWADVSSTMIFTLQCTCIEVIKALGSPEQQADLFARHLRGELFAIALTEPGAGSDARSVTTRAETVDGGYRINGLKHYITNARVSGVIVVIAQTDDGISAFAVDRDAAGVSITRNEPKMGLHGTTTDEIVFEDVTVPVTARLGSGSEGFAALMRSLERGRVSIGAVAVGLARRCIAEASEHLASRQQFGHALSEFQGLQFLVADMETGTSAADALVVRAAEAVGTPAFRSLSAQAKSFATDNAMKVATDAVQLFGGAGYMRGVVVERMMRDAKILQIFEGTNQIMRQLIARDVFKRTAK
jgi:alkylation response protein AidB-like acyl-CoA dehydrogenase